MANQPGQGAIFTGSRFAHEHIRYVHQPFPSMRFHPDGREQAVTDPEDDAQRCPQSEGWTDKPFPPKPKPAPVKELTVADMQAKLEAQAATFDKSWTELVAERDALKKENLDLKAQLAVPASDTPDASDKKTAKSK